VPVTGLFQNTQPPPLFPSIFFASSAFSHPENFEKVKYPQAITSLVGEIEEEHGGFKAHSSEQVRDEHSELEEPSSEQLEEVYQDLEEAYEQLEQKHLKVDLMGTEDMHRMEDRLEKVASLASSGSGCSSAALGSLNWDVEAAEADLDDVDASLMGLETASGAGSGMGVPTEAHRERTPVLDDVDDSGLLGHVHGDSMASEDLALDHETASGADSGLGVPTRTSPAAPPSLSVMPPPSSQSCPPPLALSQFWFILPHNKF
jgi:hypothetical protein